MPNGNMLFTERLNILNKLAYLEADTPEKLINILSQIHMPTNIIQFVVNGKKHGVWFYTEAKIVKKGKK